VSAGLVLVTVLAWAASLQPGAGMMEVETTWPGRLSFIMMWTVMMTAMMLPAEFPAVLLFATVSSSRSRFGFRPVSTAVFATGYLGLWALTGAGVALLDGFMGAFLTPWNLQLTGGALLAAGVYQLTRWKFRCLHHCRTPLHFFMEQWRDGPVGALQMGVQRGLYCLGCCWGLMLVLLALGVMNVVWMALVAALVFAEKVMPFGEVLARIIGVGLLLAGMTFVFGAPSGIH
jgi:predicted metal-binding membrane protein